jgi:hypothetical protein
VDLKPHPDGCMRGEKTIEAMASKVYFENIEDLRIKTAT